MPIRVGTYNPDQQWEDIKAAARQLGQGAKMTVEPWANLAGEVMEQTQGIPDSVFQGLNQIPQTRPIGGAAPILSGLSIKSPEAMDLVFKKLIPAALGANYGLLDMQGPAEVWFAAKYPKIWEKLRPIIERHIESSPPAFSKAGTPNVSISTIISALKDQVEIMGHEILGHGLTEERLSERVLNSIGRGTTSEDTAKGAYNLAKAMMEKDPDWQAQVKLGVSPEQAKKKFYENLSYALELINNANYSSRNNLAAEMSKNTPGLLGQVNRGEYSPEAVEFLRKGKEVIRANSKPPSLTGKYAVPLPSETTTLSEPMKLSPGDFQAKLGYQTFHNNVIGNLVQDPRYYDMFSQEYTPIEKKLWEPIARQRGRTALNTLENFLNKAIEDPRATEQDKLILKEMIRRGSPGGFQGPETNFITGR